MCHREGRNLQQGMNYQESGNHSIILMSRRQNAPYEDEILEDGSTLIYEGHDVGRYGAIDPKTVDQPLAFPTGAATENGKFFAAAKAFVRGALPRRVRVYEKIQPNIWAYNGVFHLVDAWAAGKRSSQSLQVQASRSRRGGRARYAYRHSGSPSPSYSLIGEISSFQEGQR